MLFADRREAGRQLAAKLEAYAGRSDVTALALPRGGVPVAFEVAKALRVPLDVFVVRKLGAPGHKELAMGAIAGGGTTILDRELIEALGITKNQVDEVIEVERRELERRELVFRSKVRAAPIAGRVVILVDDGLATGSTMLVAVLALRKLSPARIIVAAPVASPETFLQFCRQVDEVVCVETPEPFYAVGLWYRDFTQTTDEEVGALLAKIDREIRGPVRARA